MKNIFNEADKNEIIHRIEKLAPSSQAQWGKMDVGQMLAHCAVATQMPAGKLKTKSALFPLRIIGKLLKSMILDESPFRRNTTTTKEMKITGPRDFEKEKANLIAAVNALYTAGEKGVKAEIHPFMGKMSPLEWGRLNYKHADHHLRQFGV